VPCSGASEVQFTGRGPWCLATAIHMQVATSHIITSTHQPITHQPILRNHSAPSRPTMNLIAYSDSEESDTETPQASKPTVPAKTALKPAFHRVVDRSQPGKIKLNLPTPSQSRVEKDDIEADAPPAKKARTGGGAFGGFNSMLPAPKKPNAIASSVNGGAISANRGVGKGLGAGVNLRTGAEPAFQRSTRADEEYDENGNPIKKSEGKPMQKQDFRALFNLPPPKAESKSVAKKEAAIPGTLKVEQEVAAKPRFMPLSVARGKKKKPVVPKPAASLNEAPSKPALSTDIPVPESKPAKPKISLFSAAPQEHRPSISVPGGSYEPLLHGVVEDDDAPVPDEAFDETNTYPAQRNIPAAHARDASQNLTNIAQELNLTEAERRQLFGRKGRGPDLSAANVVEFNTDREYAHNEMLRQQGETTQQNTLKSISGTGKNSLRSLVAVAGTQKDALEDHFAAGRRNKKEAGNKYGW
jgi:hypothetical protein